MVCIGYCLLGFILLGSMIACFITTSTSSVFNDFRKLLNIKQLLIYKSIAKERSNIYIQGLVIGIALAVITELVLRKNKKFEKISRVCIFVIISLGVSILYYILMPKSTYMLKHLNGKKQIDGWLNIYKEMKTRSYIGILVGVIGYIILFYGFC